MEKQQEMEWAAAQMIEISIDLVAAAKQQLHFLAEVYKNPQLSDGPALDRAVYRYKYYWLPLLAKHVETQVTEGPLVVPFDCEWVWHCHRLNPLQYATDCQDLYGKILDNQNVVSSTQAISKEETEKIWYQMYPGESYELNVNSQIPAASTNHENFTDYDLISATKRQSGFYSKASSSYVIDDTFLEVAVDRYKGFLYLAKSSLERTEKASAVPTLDVDIIWHSHQLQPAAYWKDLVAYLGGALMHNDDVSDSKKLDNLFMESTKQWKKTFGINASHEIPAISVLICASNFIPSMGKSNDKYSENQAAKILQG